VEETGRRVASAVADAVANPSSFGARFELGRPGVPGRERRLIAPVSAGYQTNRFDSARALPNQSFQRSGWESSSGGNGQVTISWVARRDYSAPAAR